jgi:starvation-inducible outer membrane lipoprotein
MKNRWIGGLALATALMLGACAPPQQGAEETDAADQAVESASPSVEATEMAEPAESAEESEGAEPTPDDYEY